MDWVWGVLLTITTSHEPATDLGYLLHKNPAGHHVAQLGFGTAHVIYPEAHERRCQAAVILEVDTVGLVRGGRPAGQATLARYINDRPYTASSFLSVALGRLFGTALAGRSRERPELASTPIPLELGLPVLPSRGGEDVVRRLFEPLGYAVTARPLPLDSTFPDWGDSAYLAVTLSATATVADALSHLYVLLPVLDDDKHYYVGADEVDKLLRRAGQWLADHPERELITARYLRHDRKLASAALTRLLADEVGDPDGPESAESAEAVAEHRPGLQEQRIAAVVALIAEAGAQRVLDLGCGSGKLMAELLKLAYVEQVTGLDVAHRALAAAAGRLHLDQLSPRARERVELLHGSLTYTDSRLAGFDAAALVEVIEHLDPPRLAALEQTVFGHARPALVVLTTPNAEYNALFPTMPRGQFRHSDHRFEWSRAQLREWAEGVAARHGYRLEISGIGSGDAALGHPTQLAVFRR
ncbi:MAG TPA: 3' terminal RNA ribose 2'-O-methyltransferase Hen1 [Streptosporangiaceae bacterium]